MHRERVAAEREAPMARDDSSDSLGIPAITVSAARQSQIATNMRSSTTGIPVTRSRAEVLATKPMEISKKKWHPFLGRHFQAVLYRRWIIIKRSWKMVLFSILSTLIASGLAIVAQYLMKSLMGMRHEQLDFSQMLFKTPNITASVEVDDTLSIPDPDEAWKWVDTFQAMYERDTGEKAYVQKFKSRADLNAAFFACSQTGERNQTCPLYRSMGIGIMQLNSSGTDIIIYFNQSEELAERVATTFPVRLEWSRWVGSDFYLERIPMLKRLMNYIFGYLAPLLISTGLLSIVPLLIAQPILDVRGEVRQYMQTATLSLVCYWTASWLVDLIFWLISITLVWAVFLACQIQAFIDNIWSVWYAFAMAGPSTILMVYCLVFVFRDPESASRQAFLIMDIILLIPIIVEAALWSETKIWLEWIYCWVPSLHTLRLLSYILVNMKPISWQPWSHYWTYNHSQPYMIAEILDIIVWAGILTLIESVRGYFQRAEARRTFGDYSKLFEEEKKKHMVTEEAEQNERFVKGGTTPFAVRCVDVSRLFFNTSGDPIPAVNCVTLGVKEGSIYGFLGANGAGKTTLMKMITSMLPPSHGLIEIMGQDINVYNDTTLLSVCPQFNTHLCMEMTAREHFRLYSMLFQLTEEEEAETTERLIATMGLEDVSDTPVSSLSGGDLRKVAIALSFLGPAKIILLDEPTASLDAVGRRCVHEMIMAFKGEKTFMLCTHLLSEAEELCDEISIMVKGCVYTAGSPEYLSAKFGTDFRLDVGLVDDSEAVGAKCDRFFEQQLPHAHLSIIRPRARIYNVPADRYKLSKLFQIMQAAKGSSAETGIVYYTASSSSLERVFMEIVRISDE